MADLSSNICAQCGKAQTDDIAEHGTHAPMLHYGTTSYHLDCMPYDIEALHIEQHGEYIAAAKAGKRGQELRELGLAAAAKFHASEQAWLADEAAAHAETGEANTDPTHPMRAKAGA